MSGNQYEKNIRIITEELIKEFDQGSEYVGSATCDIGKAASWFYRNVMQSSIKKRALEEHEILITCACKVNGNNLDRIVDEHLEDYLRKNEIYVRSNRRHERFSDLKGILREEFKARLEFLVKLIRGEGENYDELLRNVFPNPDDAKEVMDRNFGYVLKVMKLMESEKRLIKIPEFAKDDAITIVRSTFDYASERFNRRISEIYNT